MNNRPGNVGLARRAGLLKAATLCTWLVFVPVSTLHSHQAEKSNQDPPRGPVLGAMEVLTPLHGANLNEAFGHIYAAVKHEWFATMPKAVAKGARGIVVIQFTVKKDGTVVPSSVLSETNADRVLEEHAMGAIRKAAPFDLSPQPTNTPDEITLRFTFHYNVTAPTR
jgi:TonB family protein